MGTVQDIVAKLLDVRNRWAITRYTVRSIGPIAEVIAALHNSER
jgi:hypothetical protein